METAEERLRVLRLVESGVVTAEQGHALLEALEAAPPAAPLALRATGVDWSPRAGRTAAPPAAGAGWLRLRVVDRLGRQKAEVQVPVSVLDLALTIGGRWLPQLRLLDAAMLIAALPSRAGRRVFVVDDGLGGDRVEISIE